MNATTQNQRYALQELEKEALMGAEGEETFAREVRCIDLSNFAARKNDIAEQLWEAAVEIGFFQVSHHGIPLADIRQAFSMTEAFFDLPDEVKRQYPLAGNAGLRKAKRRFGHRPARRIKKSPIRSPGH